MRTDFETSGDIRDVDLLAAFVGFWRSRASGAISFSRATASASFGLAAGEIVSVSSSEARFESSAILVRAGKLDGAALERLSIPEGTDGALAALQTGILTKREWRWGEKIRAIEILADLLAWPDGKYYFDADARPVAGEFTLTVPRLLLELFLRSRDRNLIEHQLGPSDAPLVRSEDFDREFSSFGLTADAESVVRLIDGTASADDIARAAPAEDFAVRKLLAALTTLGLVTGGAAPSAPALAGNARGDSGSRAESDEPAMPAGDRHARPDAIAGREEDAEEGKEGEEEKVETRRVPTQSASRGETAPEVPSDWDVSPFESSRRGSAFDFDPPGSTTPLEAYPLPGDTRDARHASAGEPDIDAPRSRGSRASLGSDYGSASELEPEPEPEPDSGPGAYSPSAISPDAREGSRTSAGTILGVILAALVVTVAAILYFRARPVSSARAGADVPPPAPTSAAGSTTAAPSRSPFPVAVVAAPQPTSARMATVPSPVVRAAAVPATPLPARRTAGITPTAIRVAAVRPTSSAPASRPTSAVSVVRPTGSVSAVRPTAPPARSAAAARSVPERKTGSREEWSTRAARDARRLAGEKTTRYAIQLELACEAPSLSDAFQHDRPAGSMWLLATRHGTRDCFRVLWGRYPSIDAAKRAKSGTPTFFSTDRNHPAVVSVR